MDLLTARRGLASLIVLAATLGMAQLVLSQARAPAGTGYRGASLEYQVKAAYLLNFTRYVEWPSQAFQAPTDPVRVCVLGRDPFDGVLDATLEGKTTQGRPLALRRVRSSADAAGCHLVFISRETWRTLGELPRTLRSPGRLTVGESDEFAQAGGVIGFVIQDEAVRFVVNAEARDRAGLRISSRMLSLAAAVYGQELGP
ncbi:MAG TPA: YfiR family protein [Gemmatimonadales bacterium]|nr:YfiR family protein [Gemmatimonadales bacterium]